MRLAAVARAARCKRQRPRPVFIDDAGSAYRRGIGSFDVLPELREPIVRHGRRLTARLLRAG